MSGDGWTGFKSENSIFFSNGVIRSIGEDRECNIVFSNAEIDLDEALIVEKTRDIEINVIFSNATLILSSDKPIVVEGKHGFRGNRSTGWSIRRVWRICLPDTRNPAGR